MANKSQVKVNSIVNLNDDGPVIFNSGLTVPTNQQVNVLGNVNITGVSTFSNLNATNVNVSGVVTASSFIGDGSNLTGMNFATESNVFGLALIL